MLATETYFQCIVASRLFSLTDAFATAIQRPTIYLAEVIRRKKQILAELAIFRQQFDVLFDNATDEGKTLDLNECSCSTNDGRLLKYSMALENYSIFLMYDHSKDHSTIKRRYSIIRD